MTATCAVVESPASFDPSSESVWDRLWRYQPSDDKDDALLLRERRGPRWQLVARRLEDTFGRIAGLRTIELGSGRGDLSVMLAQQGAQVTLMDRSDRALDAARKRFERLGLSAQFEKGDLLTGQDRWNRDFDVSLSIGVIEHFKGDERTRVLATHFDVLKPGGLSMVSVPHARCPPYRLWKSYLEFRGWWPYGMELPYSKHELRRRAGAAGFRRIETHTMGFWQSVGSLWGKRLYDRWPDWGHVRSRLDGSMGWVLVMLAHRDALP